MNIAKITVAVVAAGMLSGCLLAITNPDTTTDTTPVAPASVAPVTSVPTPVNYSTQEMAIFTAVNQYRSRLDLDGGPGVGMVAQDTTLDTAAKKHEIYLTSQPGGDIEDHNEVSTGVNYYAATPHDRAVLAGFLPATAWIGEVIGTGQATIDDSSGLPACLSQLLDSVYHLEALTSNVQKIGLYNDPNWACVLEGATITGTDGTILPASGNDEPVGGGQQMSILTAAVSPYKGETAVLPAMSLGENPEPDLPTSAPGHPVMLRVRADFTTDVLRVDSFTLTDGNGNAVAGTILMASNATATSTNIGAKGDTLIQPGVAFFVPSAVLADNMTYTAHFTGARDGVAVNRSWTFTTQ